ncbi:MAG: membrane bound O-acyl transferase family-domain-containing protein [Polyangia bacterium]
MALACTWFVLVAAALLATGGKVRRTSAVVLAALATLIPLVVDSFPLLRVVSGIAAVAGLARTVDLAREQPSRPAAARVLQVLVVFDCRLARPTRPRLDPAKALRTLVYAMVSSASVICVYYARTRPLPLLLGSMAAAVAIWSTAEWVSTLVRVVTELTGWALPSLHDRPIESRSLGELWGKRWNLTVTRWLHGATFVPVARRHGATLGLFAAFSVSALFHAYISYAGGGVVLALSMGSFFVVQAILMLVERGLHVTRWPAWAARTWMLAGMLIPSPLFTEPMIAVSMPTLSPLGRYTVAQPQAAPASMPSAAKLGT